MNIKDIPKVELHVHLDGSMGLDLAAKTSGFNREHIIEEMIAPNKCVDLVDYLTKFGLPVSCMQTSNNLRDAAYDLAKQLEDDKVIYAEVRFAPLKHIENGLTLDEVVLSVLSGFNSSSVKVNLILCMMRHDCFEDNLKVIELASKYLGKGVCALDLAGDEYGYKTSCFEELFKVARDKNIPFTIHAGEADDYKSVLSAIQFGAKRIGHGIRSLEDKKVIEQLKEKDILLEVCPSSNIQTNVVDIMENHPIKELINLGVKCSINTDNRTVSNTTLNKEYTLLSECMKFDLKHFYKMNVDAIKHSFLSESEKRKLLSIYNSMIIQMKINDIEMSD